MRADRYVNTGSSVTTIEVTSPWDGVRVGELAITAAPEVAAVADRLRAAQAEWTAIGPARRASWVRRLRDHVLSDLDRFAATLTAETGKPDIEARVEVLFATEAMRFYAARAPRYLAPRRVGSLTSALGLERTTVTPLAHPLVGVISPWNFPLGLAAVDAVPALLAGATVLLKPSDLAPLSAQLLVDTWRAMGAPDVIDLVVGPPTTGEAVVDLVDYVAFTGSSTTGRAVARRAAERMIPVSLELGGNDAMVVLADADLELAASAAVYGSMCNGGQMCVSTERVYVEAPAYQRFVDLLRTRLAALPRHDVTPLASAAQLEIVRSHVEEARAAGATAESWLEPEDGGTWFPPTLVLDATDEMRCVSDETFGPVLPVLRVADARDAVQRVNGSPYGLSATVWTRDAARGREIAQQLEVGAVNVNCVFSNIFVFEAPQQGWKSSGTGARFGGSHAVLRYCRERVVVEARHPFPTQPHWFPYTAARRRALSVALRVLGRRARRRLRRSPAGTV